MDASKRDTEAGTPLHPIVEQAGATYFFKVNKDAAAAGNHANVPMM